MTHCLIPSGPCTTRGASSCSRRGRRFVHRSNGKCISRQCPSAETTPNFFSMLDPPRAEAHSRRYLPGMLGPARPVVHLHSAGQTEARPIAGSLHAHRRRGAPRRVLRAARQRPTRRPAKCASASWRLESGRICASPAKVLIAPKAESGHSEITSPFLFARQGTHAVCEGVDITVTDPTRHPPSASHCRG